MWLLLRLLTLKFYYSFCRKPLAMVRLSNQPSVPCKTRREEYHRQRRGEVVPSLFDTFFTEIERQEWRTSTFSSRVTS
jgi:hypothetical protein